MGVNNKTGFKEDLNLSCETIANKMEKQSITEKLAGIYPLFFKSCFKEVIAIGGPVREQFRDKVYSVTRETSEVLVNEGVFKDYVLEAYERAHLSYMLALSYLKLGQPENAKIELRRANDEMKAKLYTSGDDELNLLLIANLWEQLGAPTEAIPNYRKIIEMKDVSPSNREFTKERLELLEFKGKKQTQPPPIHVYAIGDFPNVVYSGINSFRETYPMGFSLKNCRSQTGALINTTAWSQKITLRGQDDVSFYKKVARTPATVIYTALIIAAGGYALAAVKTNVDAASLVTLLTVGASYRTFVMGYAPDMRYWSELPSAFVFSSKYDLAEEPCAFQYLNDKSLNPKRLL